MRGPAAVYEALAALGIEFAGTEHQPVFTIEEMAALVFPPDVMVAKNLFLRDAKGRRHFLVVLAKDRPADLRALEKTLDCSRLSFASAERLEKHLKLTKGSVSPLGLVNDPDNAVEAVVDQSLSRHARIGVHPNDNSATLFLRYEDMLKIISANGRRVHFIYSVLNNY